ncbi:MAG: hypothetical protein ACJLS3_07830 [Erythrobacter sp.]
MANATSPHYGNGTAPGWKGNSPEARQNSAGAAHVVNKTLGARHAQMMAAWRRYGAPGAIPEQIADDVGLPVHVVRPRAGELVKRGLLFEAGKRIGGMGFKVMSYSIERPKGGEE